MARFSNGIFGPISGSLGGLVYSIRNGNNYVNVKRVRVSNAQTPAQVNHTAKFTAAVQFVNILKDVLNIGFKPYALKKKKGAVNMAMSYTMKNSLTGSEINYPNVRISIGNHREASDPAVSIVSPLEIEFSWKDARDQRFNDSVFVAVYNPEKQEAATVVRGNFRSAEKQSIILPPTFAGDEVHCYLAFQNERGTEVSESQYLGSLRV